MFVHPSVFVDSLRFDTDLPTLSVPHSVYRLSSDRVMRPIVCHPQFSIPKADVRSQEFCSLLVSRNFVSFVINIGAQCACSVLNGKKGGSKIL